MPYSELVVADDIPEPCCAGGSSEPRSYVHGNGDPSRHALGLAALGMASEEGCGAPSNDGGPSSHAHQLAKLGMACGQGCGASTLHRATSASR